MSTLSNIIMRRVYYAYAVDLVANAMFLKGFALAVLWGLLASFVSVRDVLANLAEQRAIDVVPYLVRAFLNTEIWTMFVLLGILGVFVAILRSFVVVRFLPLRA